MKQFYSRINTLLDRPYAFAELNGCIFIEFKSMQYFNALKSLEAFKFLSKTRVLTNRFNYLGEFNVESLKNVNEASLTLC